MSVTGIERGLMDKYRLMLDFISVDFYKCKCRH